MPRRILLFVMVMLLACAGVASADWDPDQAAKWVQFPDLTPMGIDVNASWDFILADDFECTETGPITSIHVWGSWLYDYPPFMVRPDSVKFTLSIHADDVSPGGYSIPGDVYWYREFRPGEFAVRVWRDGIEEGWMDPPDFYLFPGDSICWQYNFYIPDGEQFYQQGTPDEPIVYWLDVKAEPLDDNAVFGWKTSLDHWNDDAVWGMGWEPYFGPWEELRYPPGHEMQGQSIDLAFVIVGLPHDYDWGDAPDGAAAPGYPTLAANGGANHMMGGPWLGDPTDMPDPEADGQPHPAALGDDLDGNDDEDGVKIPTLYPGSTSIMTFEVRGGNGAVEGWIDFNNDMIWQHPAEQVIAGFFAPGYYSFNITTPAGAILGQTFARFRISTAGGLPPGGFASDGEVEDYEVIIEDEPPKWEQRPDIGPTGMDVNATEPFILADDFLCTEPGRLTGIVVWGSWLGDYLPYGDPEAVDFILSFHEDIPADMSPTGYSMPGDVLWYRNFGPGEFSAYVYRDSLREGWMDPPDYWVYPGDHICWKYKFHLPPEEAYFQEGTEDDPIVYWLDVQAIPHDPDAFFGWKTSLDAWNDDAVWGTGMEPYFGPWYELIYPPMHEMADSSIDLAFRLKTDPLSGVPDRDTGTEHFGLLPNTPNPFGSSTVLRYSLPANGHARVEVFDVTGRLVGTLVDEYQTAGEHRLTWNGTGSDGHKLPAGVYFQRLTMDQQRMTRKMLLLK
jgi:hypothetical protein